MKRSINLNWLIKVMNEIGVARNNEFDIYRKTTEYVEYLSHNCVHEGALIFFFAIKNLYPCIFEIFTNIKTYAFILLSVCNSGTLYLFYLKIEDKN